MKVRVTSAALSGLTGYEAAPEILDNPVALAKDWTRWWREHRHEYERGGSKWRTP